MKASKSRIVITQDDYETLHTYIKDVRSVKHCDRKEAALLQEELKKATLVKKEELPEYVVRLNSRVLVKEGRKDKLLAFILVVPEKADIKQRKISVLAPTGTALTGHCQGQKVKWDVPSGNTTFTIMKVYNHKQ